MGCASGLFGFDITAAAAVFCVGGCVFNVAVAWSVFWDSVQNASGLFGFDTDAVAAVVFWVGGFVFGAVVGCFDTQISGGACDMSVEFDKLFAINEATSDKFRGVCAFLVPGCTGVCFTKDFADFARGMEAAFDFGAGALSLERREFLGEDELAPKPAESFLMLWEGEIK